MKLFSACSSLAIAMFYTQAAAAQTAEPAEAPAEAVDDSQVDLSKQNAQGQIADIVITATRRDTNLQDTPVAISAFSGGTLEEERILSFEDLAGRATSMSFTALSPLDQEFNIRGITNTRLDSPSADQSIGIFVDDVYVGRSGLFNFDMFDIDRVEVIRGPQGVLLGRNVVGGAISIFSARPRKTLGGSLNIGYGNYDEKLVRGHVTGPLHPDISGRVAFQYRNRDGFNRDILHHRDLDNIDSLQGRASFLYNRDGSDFRALVTMDYTKDKSNGFHSVAIDGPPAGSGPWSAARAAIAQLRGGLDIREGLPEWPQFSGEFSQTPIGLDREAVGFSLRLEKGLGDLATFTAVTGYRQGKASNLYSQTGIGPTNGYVLANPALFSPILFTSDVGETEKIGQFSQEVRLVSNPVESGLEWIVGAYYQRDKVRKNDVIIYKIPSGGFPTLNGESRWFNRSTNESYAVFGQLGYRFSEMFRVVGGVRYSHDKKGGRVRGLAVENGDQYHPLDTVAATPLAPGYAEGTGYTANYGDKWSEVTPQVTAEFKPNDNMLFYATYSTGYKGGGFEDDPANPAAAASSYDPETVTNMEVGTKLDLFDRRVRLNLAAFRMRYKDLQVTQTDAGCLCNITDNAADAKIKGIEAEATVAVTRGLTLFGGLTLLDTKYIDFIDSVGRNNSGKFLQRTPKYQYNIGGDFTTDLGAWTNGLSIHVNYSYQAKMYWAPDNLQDESPYGLLDGRVTLTPNDGDVTLSVWGKNITNKLYRTNIIAFFGDEVSRLGAPRTYGVEVGFRF
ncbi:MAG TPA: TonB-dependent receptor [Sphingomicrobium sp.]|nr:TonB-dependent receptor [Sphingomicrobium sp.]